MASSLILASGSEYKRKLLERLGVPFRAVSADLDEATAPHEAPGQTAGRLAAQKARTVAAEHGDAWVLGADQVVSIDGEQLGKPATPAGAADQLRQLNGRSHRLVNAIALVTPDGDVHRDAVEFDMVMRELTDRQIEAYIQEEMPLNCAGAYKIESAGIRLFRAMRGDDYTAIIGLPLTRVWNILEASGYFSSHQTPSDTDGTTT